MTRFDIYTFSQKFSITVKYIASRPNGKKRINPNVKDIFRDEDRTQKPIRTGFLCYESSIHHNEIRRVDRFRTRYVVVRIIVYNGPFIFITFKYTVREKHHYYYCDKADNSKQGFGYRIG